MKKLLLKLAIFFSPFAVVGVLTALQPHDNFYFKASSALKVYQLSNLLPGPFYPLQKLSIVEEGDMGHGTPFAIKNTVYWETDRYGYRKADSNDTPDIVVIGDSMIYGSGLTQSDIFTEMLQRKLQRFTYPYASGSLNVFLAEKRFTEKPPKIVILEMNERDIISDKNVVALSTNKKSIKYRIKSKIESLLKVDNIYLIKSVILLDRIFKTELSRYIEARLFPTTVGVRHHDLFFFQGTKAPVKANESDISRTIRIISSYNDYFKNKNIRFIFMPVPNKETIYHDLLPSKPEFTILRQVIQGLKQAGVPTIDLLSAFELCKQNGGNPYLIDDTHWNALGVRIAADVAADLIRQSNLIK